MTQQPIAIVLGGTNPHISLIENLKSRGYYTVLIDYFENPPAKEAADEHVRESTLDTGKIIEIAKRFDASLVISTCIDHANATACFVAEQLNLPLPYSYKTALNVTDKQLMKSLMLTNDIQTSKHISVSSIEELNENIGKLNLPLVVKPSDCTGSKGVKKAENIEELKTYFADAKSFSRNDKVIVEEFVEGKEIQIDCFVRNGISKVIMVRQKIPLGLNNGLSMQTLGSIIPVNLPSEVNTEINNLANKIATVFEINNSTLFIQAIVDKDGQINVLEFAPRVGGGLSYKLVKSYTGIDVVDATVDTFLGKDHKISPEENNFFLHSIIVYAKEGVFDHVSGYEKLIEDSIIEEFYFFKTKGMEIGSDMSTKSRIGAFVVKSATKEDLNAKINQALARLSVFDIKNNEILRRDIYKSFDSNNSLIK